MNKKQISTIAVYAILLVVFNVLFFAIPFEKTAISWVSFVFTWIAFLVGYAITHYAFRGTDTLQSKVYGFPIFRLGYLYLGTQLVTAFILCFAGVTFAAPAWIAVVLSVLFLAAALVGVIAADNTRDMVQDLDRQTAIQTKAVKTFRLDVASLVAACKDPVAKKKMEALSEAFQYSDPVSNDDLAAIEAQLANEVENLKGFVLTDDANALIGKIDEIGLLLADRNRRCKEGK